MPSRTARLTLTLMLAALGATGAAACRHAEPSVAASSADADSCTAVRERVRGSGYLLADVPPLDDPRNAPAPTSPEPDAPERVPPPFVVSYLITLGGAVDGSTIAIAGPIAQQLEGPLLRAVRRWRFTPARYHGCAVPHQVHHTFSFSPAPK